MSQTYELAEEALRLAIGAGLTIVTAESCTGGLVAGALTDVPGSSRAMDRGFVTYSNAAKTELLGVPAELIEAHGAVSAEVARAMAEGALKVSGAGVAVAVTGVAGPDGGTEAKPVGLVHFAAVRAGATPILEERRFGALLRNEIRAASVHCALDLLCKAAANRSMFA